MEQVEDLLLGANSAKSQVVLFPRMANRHGLIAGATGTGKTVTLQILAEQFSRMGVPVFSADIKGDLSGLATKAKPHEKIDERINRIGIENYQARPCPVVFWDLFGKTGHPVRTTLSEMGPVLISKLLDLNETQSGVIQIAFRVADDEGLLLLDLKDLRSMLSWMADNRKELRNDYGHVAPASIGAIQRRLLSLEERGGEQFFGEPALNLKDLMQTDFSGNGVISLLDATRLIQDSSIYSTFLLWLLSELFEQLDEVGDPEKPRLVFFFDEAHLLFRGATKALLEKIETVVRLIRSKGVGVYFVTQHPADIPDRVLGQLGNRIQHGLRSLTPKEQTFVRSAAESFRPNPEFDTASTISDLRIGEALVSVLDLEGRPTMVERTLIVPPESQIGPLQSEARSEMRKRSPLGDRYENAVDRESAYELLKKREEENSEQEKLNGRAERKSSSSKRQSAGEAFFKSVLRSIGSQLGRRIVRGIMGSITRGR